jgi:hypothetical protein
VADRLDPVAVGIEQERPVVAGVIVRPHPGGPSSVPPAARPARWKASTAWRPAATAAIDKAVNPSFYMLADDIQGQPRATAPDIGADEASMAPVTIPGPLTTADVGPDAP